VTQLPEFVYFVTTVNEWPVSVAVDYGDGRTVEAVAELVERRLASQNVLNPAHVHVWKARVTDVEEVEFVPARVTPAELKTR